VYGIVFNNNNSNNLSYNIDTIDNLEYLGVPRTAPSLPLALTYLGFQAQKLLLHLSSIHIHTFHIHHIFSCLDVFNASFCVTGAQVMIFYILSLSFLRLSLILLGFTCSSLQSILSQKPVKQNCDSISILLKRKVHIVCIQNVISSQLR
jgi:hypothetical protein